MVSSSVGRLTPWFQDVFGFLGDLFEAANQTLLETQIVDTFMANAAKKAKKLWPCGVERVLS